MAPMAPASPVLRLCLTRPHQPWIWWIWWIRCLFGSRMFYNFVTQSYVSGPVKMMSFQTVLGMGESGHLADYFTQILHFISSSGSMFVVCVGLFLAVFQRFTLVWFRLKASHSTANAPWTTLNLNKLTKKIYRTTWTFANANAKPCIFFGRDGNIPLSKVTHWYRLWISLSSSFLTFWEKRNVVDRDLLVFLFLLFLSRLWLWMLGFLMHSIFIWRITSSLTTHILRFISSAAVFHCSTLVCFRIY